MSIKRTLIGAMCAVLAGGVCAVQPAAATQTDVVVIKDGPHTVKTFGPIPGQFPLTTAAVPEPQDCGDAGAADGVPVQTATLQFACDRVPIDIVVPDDLDFTEDFLVVIKVTWTPSDQIEDPSGEVGNAALNDLDLYLYDDQQIAKRDDPKSESYTEMGSSGNAVPPEVVKMFRPELGRYNLVVVNWSGANVDYTVDAWMERSSFDYPFEDLGPTFRGRASTTDSFVDEPSDFGAPFDYSAFDDPKTSGPVEPAALPSLAPVGVDPLPFIGTGESTFDDALRAPDVGRKYVPAGITGPIAPASVPLVVFWLAVVPLAVLAVIAVILGRRRRSLLAVDG